MKKISVFKFDDGRVKVYADNTKCEVPTCDHPSCFSLKSPFCYTHTIYEAPFGARAGQMGNNGKIY